MEGFWSREPVAHGRDGFRDRDQTHHFLGLDEESHFVSLLAQGHSPDGVTFKAAVSFYAIAPLALSRQPPIPVRRAILGIIRHPARFALTSPVIPCSVARPADRFAVTFRLANGPGAS
jgi:hypothetical protein